MGGWREEEEERERSVMGGKVESTKRKCYELRIESGGMEKEWKVWEGDGNEELD